MLSNYFALEPVLLERIRAEVDGLIAVYTPFSVEDMFQLTNASPSVSLIYTGDRVVDDAGKGKASVIYQQWLVALAVREESAQLDQTQSLRTKADPLIRQILAALQGFNPNIAGFRDLKRVPENLGVASSAGFSYFPFMFESQVFI